MPHRGKWVHLIDPQTQQMLELNWYPSDSPFGVEYLPGEGLDHIGFTVDNVKEKFDELVAKGAVPTEVNPAKTGGFVAFLKDPDGNWIEIFEQSPPTAD